MSIKSYKLIPISVFSKSDLNSGKNDNESEEIGDGEASKRRSIRSIIENSLENEELKNSDFTPSSHHVAEQKIPQQGEGVDKEPIFLPNTGQLPQFSRGSRVKKSYDNVLNILNDDSLSDELKIKFYTLMRHKYNAARRNRAGDNYDGIGDDEDDDDYDDEDNFANAPKRRIFANASFKKQESLKTIRDIVDVLPPNKQKNGYKIVNVLMRNQKHIGWDLNGDIIRPIHRNIDVIPHMKNFMILLLYRNKGDVAQIAVLGDIVKPFYRAIENYVLNARLKNEMDGRVQNVKLSKYVSW